MTPQERQMIEDLFDRLGRLENAPRDADAVAAISDGLRKAPNAIYALVQTVLLQDEALRRANSRIQELEAAAGAGEPHQATGFLNSMRETIFGQNQPRGSVPNVPPPTSRPVWNSGQVMQQAQSPGQYNQAPYGQPYGAPQPPVGGGSFLGTAAAAAAGLVGGSLLLGGIRSMMGGSHYGFGDSNVFTDQGQSRTPWSDQSGSTLAQDAGIDNISSSDRGDDNSRAGLFNSAGSGDPASDDDNDDRDDMDMDSDDFGGDDGSNSA